MGRNINDSKLLSYSTKEVEKSDDIAKSTGRGMIVEDVDDSQIEDIPMLQAILTYICYLILNFMGRLKDKLITIGLQRNFSPKEPKLTRSFVPLYQEYEAFYTRNIYRRIRDCWNHPVASNPGAYIELINRETKDYGWTFTHIGGTTKVLNMGSYNYLGFSETQGVCADSSAESVNVWGCGFSGSRQELGQLSIHKHLEELMAEFTGQEDACIFPMGFATNALNIPTLIDKYCCVISDELNHASLILGIRLSGAEVRRFKHNDMKSLEHHLRQAVLYGHSKSRRAFKKIFILVEGIYSMEGSIINLPKVVELKKKYKAYLYLDEAHSIGAMGSRGRGICDHYGVHPADIDIMMGTFTKSFGSVGGYIAGRSPLINYIRCHSHSYVYGGGIPGPVCQQIVSSISVIMGKLSPGEGLRRIRQLAWNTRYFRKGLHNLGLIVYGPKDSPVIPVIIFMPSRMAAFFRECLKRGLGTAVVGFPATSLALGRARFCMSASHTKEMLDEALKIIEEVAACMYIKFSSRKCPPSWTLEPLSCSPQDSNSTEQDQSIKEKLL